MTQTSTAPAKLSPTDRRFAFIKDCTAALADRDIMAFNAKGTGIEIPEFTIEQLTEIAQRMVTEGVSLGRTMGWKTTCGFAKTEIDAAEKAGTLDVSTARWAVLQGSIFMGHAA